MYRLSWAASRLVKASLVKGHMLAIVWCHRTAVRQTWSWLCVVIELEVSFAVNVHSTYPEEAPPLERGAPVSPSPIRGTATEKERVETARLTVAAGRTNWRSMMKLMLEGGKVRFYEMSLRSWQSTKVRGESKQNDVWCQETSCDSFPEVPGKASLCQSPGHVNKNFW